MNMLVKNLGLKNCGKFVIGDNVQILLNELNDSYMTGFDCQGIVIKIKDKYFKYGYCDNNKIISDLEMNGEKVEDLETYLKQKIFNIILKELENYYQENKNRQIFNKDSVFLYRNLEVVGKNPLGKIEKNIKYYIDYPNLENGEFRIANNISYNMIDETFYVNGKYIPNKTENEVFKEFTTNGDINLYVLFRNYEENNLKGEDLAYKEIAELNKWLEKDNKSNITVVYDKDGEEKERKVKNYIDGMFSGLSKDYYEEMFSFWGIEEIKSIKQIKGFKYRNDFYKWNIENLLYRKENV